jgi:hypothetical protein
MTTTNYSADDTALLIVDPYNDFMIVVRAAHIQVIIVPHHRWREGTIRDGSI